MKSFKHYLLEVGEQLTFDFDKPKETIHTQPPTDPPVYVGTAYSPETFDDRAFDKQMYKYRYGKKTTKKS